MISISLDEHSHIPMYMQIYEYIKKEIREGSLSYPERLPSSRSLSSFLQVSRSTVDAAYDQLVSEGYIEARTRQGYYVSQITHNQHFLSMPSSEISSIPESPDFMPEYDLNPYAIDTQHFPYSIWKSIGKNQLDNPENFLLADSFGTKELRQAIAVYLHGSRGVFCLPGNIIVGAGLDHLLQMLCILFERNVTIAMEDPGYQSARQIFIAGGCHVVDLPLKEKMMDIESLQKTNAPVCYVTPSHQFPLGSVMPVSRRQELLDWAALSDDRYIIEDDHDSEFRYSGKPIPSLQSLDSNEKVIYLGTFSKSVSPAIRTGYMVLPDRLMDKYRHLCGFYACPVSRIQQAVLADFIRKGFFEKHLNRMRKYYKIRHDSLIEHLSSRNGDGLIEISGDNAGLYLILRYLGKKRESEIQKDAARFGMQLHSLRNYYSQLPKDYVPCFMVGFGNLDEEKIAEAATILMQKVFRINPL